MKLRPEFARLRQDKRVDRKLSRLTVDRQFEAIDQQRLQSQAVLIERRIAFRSSLNVEILRIEPVGPPQYPARAGS